jgi:hypothetical protein
MKPSAEVMLEVVESSDHWIEVLKNWKPPGQPAEWHTAVVPDDATYSHKTWKTQQEVDELN